MRRRLLFDEPLLNVTVHRLCEQLIENHDDFDNSVILGLQPRGIYLAERIHAHLGTLLKKKPKLGYLDATFYRDDFRRRDKPIEPSKTQVEFSIEGANVILIDDVLFTGRTVRAAMDAMIDFGRPEKVELLVLIDRMYSRDIPIEATYVGRRVNTIESQKVLVELKQQGSKEDKIWIIDKEKQK
ncbi:MAG: bifunctional pyr operon transcriptional regulator/uracil phosphoribosyltransferase PyrR [Cyclobacteriaceae bacterium]